MSDETSDQPLTADEMAGQARTSKKSGRPKRAVKASAQKPTRSGRPKKAAATAPQAAEPKQRARKLKEEAEEAPAEEPARRGPGRPPGSKRTTPTFLDRLQAIRRELDALEAEAQEYEQFRAFVRSIQTK